MGAKRWHEGDDQGDGMGEEKKPTSGKRDAAITEGMSRRQFCLAGAAAAVVAGVGVAGGYTRSTAHAVYLRPPGAESESALLAKCDRCERCVQVCPYHLVQPRPLDFDFPTVGTPELVFKQGYCDFCMKCVEVCPTGALTMSAPSASNIGVARVISDSCVAWQWHGCTVCEDVCPVPGALVLDERGRPHVDDQLCNGCGLCQIECPAPSLRAYNAAVAEKGIYVVSRESQAAALGEALTTAQFEESRNRRAEGGR